MATSVTPADATREAVINAAEVILGACLLRNENIDAALEAGLEGWKFPRQHLRLVFDAAVRMRRAGDLVDPITLATHLGPKVEDAGGRAYLLGLTTGVPSRLNTPAYAAILNDAATARDLAAVCEATATRLREDPGAVRGPVLARLQGALEHLTTQTADNEDLLLEPIAHVGAGLSAGPLPSLMRELIFTGMIMLVFGLERSFKSLMVRELIVAMASGRGRPAFGMDRFAGADAVPVAYITEEDSAAAIYGHLDAFSDGAAGRGELPVYLSACRGLSLDDPATQDRIIRQVKLSGAGEGITVLEPLRSLTQCVDGTTRDLQPFAQFLRRLMRETGTTPVLGHHAVKPAAGSDNRRGNQRISGGGLFSVSESPVEVVRTDELRALVTPRGFKHCADPAPFEITLDVQNGQVRRLLGREVVAEPSEQEAIEHHVLTVITATPGLSGNAVATRVHGRRSDVLGAIRRLSLSGRIRADESGRGTRWYPL